MVMLLCTLDCLSFLPVGQFFLVNSFLSLFGKHRFLTFWFFNIKQLLQVSYQAIPSLLSRDGSGYSKFYVIVWATFQVSTFIFQRRKQGLNERKVCESF